MVVAQVSKQRPAGWAPRPTPASQRYPLSSPLGAKKGTRLSPDLQWREEIDDCDLSTQIRAQVYGLAVGEGRETCGRGLALACFAGRGRSCHGSSFLVFRASPPCVHEREPADTGGIERDRDRDRDRVYSDLSLEGNGLHWRHLCTKGCDLGRYRQEQNTTSTPGLCSNLQYQRSNININ